MMKLGFLASHNGSNMQAVIAACRVQSIHAEPVVVISNNPESGALQRAERETIPAYYLSRLTHPLAADLDAAILHCLREHDVDLVILAGYMKKLGATIISAYSNHIINIHPSLLPAYGGEGMYGKRVHQAVLDAKETETGASVHLVDEQYDTGKVLAQCHVKVQATDTVETLAARVLAQEHKLYTKTIAEIAAGVISLSK